jgi:hypothetical protein
LPTQLADVAAGLCDVIGLYGLSRITNELVGAIEYRTQLGKRLERAMCSAPKIEAFLCSKQPLDKPVQHLSTDERYIWTRPSLVSGISTRTNRERAVLS